MPWPPRLDRWRTEIEAAASATSLAPELIAAIIDRESRGGEVLTPPGPGGTGDFGHGHGLMQIDDRSHSDWLSLGTWGDPGENILFGAKLLAFYVDQLGSLPAGIAAYNAGPGRVKHVLDSVGPNLPALDGLTTGRNYVSWVLEMSEQLQTIELQG